MPADGAPVRVTNDTNTPVPFTDRTTLPNGTNRGGAIATASTAQQLAPANLNRVFLKGQNLSTSDLWINETGATASAAQPSYRIAAGSTFSVNTTQAISIWGATAGQAFSATEG